MTRAFHAVVRGCRTVVGVAVCVAVVGGCDGGNFIDPGDPSREQITLQYIDGITPEEAWQSLYRAGADQCEYDTTIETVRFRIDDVPDDRPAGWEDAAITEEWSCEDLIAASQT